MAGGAPLCLPPARRAAIDYNHACATARSAAASPSRFQMRDPITFRPITDADFPRLYRLARAALPLDTFSLDLFVEKLTHHPWPDAATVQTLIAEHDGHPCGFMQSVHRPQVRRAWLGLFAVDETQRRRGIATALWQRTRAAWPDALERVEVLALPGNYFTPGLDPRYEAAVRFVTQIGFEKFDSCCNLTVPLDAEFETAAAKRDLASRGIRVRRATADDAPLLDGYFAAHFGADWRCEAGLALTQDPPALHLALRHDRIIAFSAHSTQNQEWGFFGPMGTAPEARGLGVGRVLLWHCLNDLRAAGHATALIPWVGPVPFYERWSRARIDRTFDRYRLPPATA
jgi:mycothiol synthase